MKAKNTNAQMSNREVISFVISKRARHVTCTYEQRFAASYTPGAGACVSTNRNLGIDGSGPQPCIRGQFKGNQTRRHYGYEQLQQVAYELLALSSMWALVDARPAPTSALRHPLNRAGLECLFSPFSSIKNSGAIGQLPAMEPNSRLGSGLRDRRRPEL